KLQNRIRTELEDLDAPGEVTVMDSAETGGFGGSLDVEVRGDNEADVATATQDVQDALEDAPAISELSSDLATEQPTVVVIVDRNEALDNGFSEMQRPGMVSGNLSPQSVGTVTVDHQDLKIYVESGSTPETVEELRGLEAPTATGMVRLDEMADVDEVNVANSKTRQDRSE